MAILPTGDTTAKGKKGQFAPAFKQPMGPIPPQSYENADPVLGIRRTMLLDNGARVAAQVEVDRGVYMRPPINPVEYSFGNIKKSTYMSGLPGYNQRELPIANSPDDMSQEQFMMATAQEIDPNARMALKKNTAIGQQFFLNTPSPGTVMDYPITSHQSIDNLLASAQRLKQQKEAKQTSDVLMASFSTTPNDVA